MAKSVYIETTIVSYLTARPTRNLIRRAQQQMTQDWWKDERDRFEIVCSELVILECSAGDPRAASTRLKAIASIPVLPLTDEATKLADVLLGAGAIPKNSSRDAAHVGICAVNRVDFLLTWNFKHLANALMQDTIRRACASKGYAAPEICSPEGLFEVKP